jgi:D-sedoheptulose 7-phosphate isomerase
MKDFFERYPELENCKEDIKKALCLMIETYRNKGKILVCGNGGSASDSEHIVGELMKGFLNKRTLSDERLSSEMRENLQGSLPAISLNSQTSLMTAFNNDLDPEYVFAQQVYGYGNKNDLLIGISTSGNSANVVNAIKVAKSIGVKSILLTGKDGGLLKNLATVSICVPAVKTYRIQEYHLPVYHYLCAKVEEEFFK